MDYFEIAALYTHLYDEGKNAAISKRSKDFWVHCRSDIVLGLEMNKKFIFVKVHLILKSMQMPNKHHLYDTKIQ